MVGVLPVVNQLTIKSYYERATVRDVRMYVCMFDPSSAHSFDLIVMKLGMDIPWDPGRHEVTHRASIHYKKRGGECLRVMVR